MAYHFAIGKYQHYIRHSSISHDPPNRSMNLLRFMKKSCGYRDTNRKIGGKKDMSQPRCNISDNTKKSTLDPPILDDDDNQGDVSLPLKDSRDIPDVVTIETGSDEDDVSVLQYPSDLPVILEGDRSLSLNPKLVNRKFRPKQVSKIVRPEKFTRALGDDWPSDEEVDVIMV
jgi:hypothetical protein